MTTYSRRKFLDTMKLGAGAALGASLLTIPTGTALASVPYFPKPRQGKKLGIALVGLGYYAKNLLAPALEKTGECYLAGIVTGTPSKIPEWKEKYNIADKNVYSYDTFDKIKDNPDIDIIYVVLPNSMHKEYTIRAAKAGKHVICEKPMALNPAECREMIAACDKAKVKLAIGYRLHSEPHTQEIMRLKREKDFGAVKLVEAADGFKIGDPTQWRLKKALAGGGAMYDVGVYCINGARYATGEQPIAVTAQEYKTDPVKFKEVDETITWQMEFSSGAVATCTTTYAASTERLYVAYEKGWAELRPAFGYGPIKGKTNKGEMDIPHTIHQALQMDDFSRCVKENKESPVNGYEGLKDLLVVEAIYKSIGSGKRELVNPV
ncbi:Gfo/Idh/MocA family oxidoreductase [Imperialibacter roseus]|uniref:Gfo/Idh/MocA family oxidoreductase n=1 Tax=Imperialibacter roseus TaxID=1324217 RepID=A0ABZ0IJP3_9BACT|nr:Gfo/Idh/MocA family oxidoreductase [Imperialibacter roseus]WOK05239.1 Gfo/Idh/MocA family oxidoreductase [Imperialibacter roseus]